MLVEPDKHKVVEGLTPEQLAKMEKEMEALQRDLKLVEESHGNQVLKPGPRAGLPLQLFANSRGQHHADIFRKLQAVCEGSSLENLKDALNMIPQESGGIVQSKAHKTNDIH